MRSSTVLLLLGAALAVASPVHQDLHKRAIKWEFVTDIVYVTVTETASGSTSAPTMVVIKQTLFVDPIEAATTSSTVHTTSTSTSTPPPPPPPPPTTSKTTPLVVPTTSSTSSTPAAKETVVPAAVAKSTSTTAAAAAAASPSDYASTAVFYHNVLRANHSAPAGTWNETLAEWAANTASTCHFAHDMTQGTGNYGQNIDATGVSDPTSDWNPSTVIANACVNDWYDGEYANFAPYYGIADPPTSGPEFLHFTQIVWKDSLSFGCASQYCGDNTVLDGAFSWFTVCNYFPAGNFLGEFNTQISEPLDKSSVDVPFPS